MQELPPLTGTRVVLRAFRIDDVPAVLAYASDTEVTRHLEWEAYDDPAMAAAFIRSTHNGPPTWYAYAVSDRETGALVGGADLRVVSPRDRRGEVGYGLARPYWGRGYAAEAAALLVRFGFARLGLVRIQALCAVDNVRSLRTLERVGMRREGRLVNYRLRHGKLGDQYLYAATSRPADLGA
jgi:RimJ/RimL family protein N-acetyltransferase